MHGMKRSFIEIPALSNISYIFKPSLFDRPIITHVFFRDLISPLILDLQVFLDSSVHVCYVIESNLGLITLSLKINCRGLF